MPAHRPVVWTRERVLALPDDGQRHELIDGELIVSPAPRVVHQRVVQRLHLELWAYVDRYGIGELFSLPGDLGLEPESVVQPDLFVVPSDTPRIKVWEDVTRLVVAIEVLSPSTARYDRGIKRHYYQRHRTPEYWVVDAGAQTIERWRPDTTVADIARHRLEWQPDAQHPPLTLDLDALFADLGGEM